MAKAELRKKGMSDELIAEATGHGDTDNQEILDARKAFAEAEARYKEEIREEAERVRQPPSPWRTAYSPPRRGCPPRPAPAAAACR